MAGPQKKTPAPIDRPLSRAYLREFTGWSTAYPPGLSDPTSLRLMENVMINKDGSARIRPGLRYLSYSTPPVDEDDAGTALLEHGILGSHEPFFLNDGTKAYLFAVREIDNTVGFRVLVLDSAGSAVKGLTDAGIDFSVPQGEPTLAFTEDTSYVKYLQVDNKIFALSNAGETMRLFTVGAVKSARKLSSIERPDWTVADKLNVIHPEAGWITNGASTGSRTNLIRDPQATALTRWLTLNTDTELNGTATPVHGGSSALKANSKPLRTNICHHPLHDVPSTGTDGWIAAGSSSTLGTQGDYLKLNVPSGSAGRQGNARLDTMMVVEPNVTYIGAFDVDDVDSSTTVKSIVRFYGANSIQIGADILGSYGDTPGRKQMAAMVAPAGAVLMRLYLGIECHVTSSKDAAFKDVVICKQGEATTMFSGDDGPGYYWNGVPDESRSYYQPDVTLQVIAERTPVTALGSVTVSHYGRANIAGQTQQVGIRWSDAADALISLDMHAAAAVTDSSWTRLSHTAAAPAGATHAALVVAGVTAARGTEHYFDSFLMEQSASLGAYFDGNTPPSGSTLYTWAGDVNDSPSSETVYTGSAAVPTPETPLDDTLISDNSVGNENQYNFGFFYTFFNEVGDSAASQVSVVSAKRRWSAWKWYLPTGGGEPSTTRTFDPNLCADQLVAIMPQAVFDQAKAQGALGWSLYMLTWSNQDAVPVEAVKVATTLLDSTSIYAESGYARVTPRSAGASDDIAGIPTAENRYNYSAPSSGGQGLVAADRMILVHDPTAAAVIRWTSNHQGDYTNFSATKGGGYKTLTSGNLFVPACVKLWQNPQSVDTLTILCQGVDGYSTGYYMAPASVTSQSDSTTIMGFEETTATPGTVSPYGCEVFNNVLYHPLDEQIMKSTASNYNINHKPITDQIQPNYVALGDKSQIVSSLLENRLYYVVHNPAGEPLEEGCNGNEIWVYDAGSETGTWSRWLIQAHSLRKIEFGGVVCMSVVRPDGIYYLDEDANSDAFVNDDGLVQERYIPWRLETNTQGANRAHDAWAHVQQLILNLGNFQGSMRWGLRSWDINGKAVNVSKIYRDLNPPDTVNHLPFDIEDSLLVRRDLQQWYFYASSIEDEAGETLPSFGQINLVQYRYTPSTVNTGYEFGSVETFEYGRATDNWAQRTTDAGVPIPYTDVRRP